jgi:hypothetical protein
MAVRASVGDSWVAANALRIGFRTAIGNIAHLVVANPVYVGFAQPEDGVVDQKLPDRGILVIEDRSPDVPLVGEIQTEVVIGGRLQIEETDALIKTASSNVGQSRAAA